MSESIPVEKLVFAKLKNDLVRHVAKANLCEPDDNMVRRPKQAMLPQMKINEAAKSLMKLACKSFQLPEEQKTKFRNDLLKFVDSELFQVLIEKAMILYQMPGCTEGKVSAHIYFQDTSLEQDFEGPGVNCHFLPPHNAQPRRRKRNLTKLVGPGQNGREWVKFGNQARPHFGNPKRYLPVWLRDGHCAVDSLLHKLLRLRIDEKFAAYEELTGSQPPKEVSDLTTHMYDNGITQEGDALRFRMLNKHTQRVRQWEKSQDVDYTTSWIRRILNFITRLMKVITCLDLDCGHRELFDDMANLSYDDYLAITGRAVAPCSVCHSSNVVNSYLLNHHCVLFEVSEDHFSDDFPLTEISTYMEQTMVVGNVHMTMSAIVAIHYDLNQIGECKSSHAVLMKVLPDGSMKKMCDHFPEELDQEVSDEEMVFKDYRVHTVLYCRT